MVMRTRTTGHVAPDDAVRWAAVPPCPLGAGRGHGDSDGQEKMKNGKLQVGIIGTGGIATSVHMPGYARLSEQVDVVAACDVQAERVAAVASGFGIPHTFTDYIQMFESGLGLDAVSICTAPSTH